METKAFCDIGKAFTLPVRKRAKITVYNRETGKVVKDYYHQDLNEILKRLHNEAFMYKERYKVVSSCGYVEYVR